MTFRLTARTRCGKTDSAVMEAETLQEAREKAERHVWSKHSPVVQLTAEVKTPSGWERV